MEMRNSNHIKIENSYLEDDIYKIRERMFFPNEDNGYTVICVPGGGMCGGNHYYLGLELCKRGYTVRLLDTPFGGLTKVNKQEEEIGFGDLNNVLNIAIDDALYNPSYDKGGERKVVTFGHSMGGFPVLECLDDRTEKAATYGTPDINSLWYSPLLKYVMKVMKPMSAFGVKFPVKTMIEMIMEKPTLEYFLNVMTKDPNYETENCPTTYPVNYMHSMMNVDIFKNIGGTSVPVLLLYGENDNVTQYTIHKAKEIAEEKGNVKIKIVPKAYHIRPCVQGEALGEFTDILDAWYRADSKTDFQKLQHEIFEPHLVRD